MTRFTYTLAPHVHACAVDEQVILLDLKRQQYVGFRATDSEAISPHVMHWPDARNPNGYASSSLESDSQELLSELSRAGMIQPKEAGIRIERRVMPSVSPNAPLIDGYEEVRPAIRLSDVFRFLAAALRAQCALKFRSLFWTMSRIERRRASAGRTGLEEHQRLVGIYLRLRPLLFTASNECLFDSLALSAFLAYYGLHPTLLIGVSISPFSAHCWLQQSDVVLNDTPEHVRKFRPILVV